MALRKGRTRRRLISRRTFIRLMLVTGIGGAVVVGEFGSRPLGYVKWLNVAGRRLVKSFGVESQVAIVNASYEGNITSALRDAWEAIDAPNLVSRRVVVVPNLTYSIPNKEVSTNPLVIEAAVRVAREKGAREVIVAAASPYHRDMTDLLYQGEGGGLLPILQKLGVAFVDLNYDDVVKVPIKGGYAGRNYVWLPRTLTQADLIMTVPKMKTDHWLGASLSLASLPNMLPGVMYGWPKNSYNLSGPEQNMADLYETLPPVMALVDGIVGMDGDGPLFGRNRATQVLVLGRDLVAVDATCARIMGFEPSEKQFRHIWQADWLGQGLMNQNKIVQKVLPLAAVRQKYEPAFPIDLNALRF